MEQALQQKPQQQQQQQQKSTNAEEHSHQTSTEAFDSVRQAALLLFRQRTKDLTRLAAVEAQSQQTDVQLQQAQTAVAALSNQQAALEAVVEEEQQRIRQREGRLASLHGALVQVDEEQRTHQKLQQAATGAIDAAAMFVSRFTDSEGRLFQLLSAAKARVGGRAARDLQAVLAQVQQRIAEACEQQQLLLCLPEVPGAERLDLAAATPESAAAVSAATAVELAVTERTSDALSAFAVIVRGWVAQSEAAWSRHGELSQVVRVLQKLSQWVAENCQPDAESAMTAHTHQEETPVFADELCGWLTDERFLTMSDGELQAAWEKDVRQPMAALHDFLRRLLAACTKHSYPLPACASESLSSLDSNTESAWTTLQQRRSEVNALTAGAAAMEERATAAQNAREAAQASLQSLTEVCARLAEDDHQNELTLQSGKEAELQNNTTAWQKGWRTIHAQRTSLLALQHAVETRENEVAQTSAQARLEAETYELEVSEKKQVLQEQQAKLTATQRELAEALAQKAALEAELALTQQTEREAQQQLEKMFSQAQRSKRDAEGGDAAHFGASVDQEVLLKVRDEAPVDVVAAVQAVPACPAFYMEWAAALDVQKDRFADPSLSNVVTEALRDLPNSESVGHTAICAVFQQVATTLQLPTALFQPDVFSEELISKLTCIASLAEEARAARVAAEAHVTSMAEANAEILLLRQELLSED